MPVSSLKILTNNGKIKLFFVCKKPFYRVLSTLILCIITDIFIYLHYSLVHVYKLPGPLSVSALYQLIDRHKSMKFSANFCG
jgi:hypothetical protein